MGLIRKLLPFFIVLTGFAMLNYGLRMIYEPASWVLCGALLIAAGLVVDWDGRRS